jgi:hypothetical protein
VCQVNVAGNGQRPLGAQRRPPAFADIGLWSIESPNRSMRRHRVHDSARGNRQVGRDIRAEQRGLSPGRLQRSPIAAGVPLIAVADELTDDLVLRVHGLMAGEIKILEGRHNETGRTDGGRLSLGLRNRRKWHLRLPLDPE